MKIKKLLCLALAIVLIFALAGCGNTNTEKEPAKETAASTDTKKEPVEIRVGHLPIPGQILYYIAQEKGYFTEENLKVSFFPMKVSVDIYNSLKGGKLDAASAGTAAPLVFISQGAPFEIVGGILGEGTTFVVKPEDNSIKSIKDLVGKKVATVRMATGDIVIKAALAREGVDLNKVQFVEFKSATDSLAALQSGKVDAAITWPPYADAAVKAGSVKVVTWSGKLIPGHTCCRVIFNKDFIAKNPDAVKGYLKALLKAQKYFNDNPEDALAIGAKALNAKVEDIRATLVDEKTSLISADPNEKAVLDFWNMMKEVGYLKSDIDITKSVETSFYKAALDELAKENAGDKFYQDQLAAFAEHN